MIIPMSGGQIYDWITSGRSSPGVPCPEQSHWGDLEGGHQGPEGSYAWKCLLWKRKGGKLEFKPNYFWMMNCPATLMTDLFVLFELTDDLIRSLAHKLFWPMMTRGRSLLCNQLGRRQICCFVSGIWCRWLLHCKWFKIGKKDLHAIHFSKVEGPKKCKLSVWQTFKHKNFPD